MKKIHRQDLAAYLGKTVQITIDRPIGSTHPEYPGTVYPVNYGYLQDVTGGDGEAQDVYLLGVREPVEQYTAKVIAVISRQDDNEDKLVAAPENMIFTLRQIRQATAFQEQYFRPNIILDPSRPLVRFYRGDPNAPKTTQKTRLGSNVLITCNGKLLLERRKDCDIWGLVGGGVKKSESELQAVTREVYEELGLRIPKERFQKLAVYGEPGRIAAYKDGSVWRMVIVVYSLELDEEPVMRISSESKELRFFTREELKDIQIVITHSDIVEDWFIDP